MKYQLDMKCVFSFVNISTLLIISSDVLSFYKEELAGETVNRVSLLAAVNGSSKSEALMRLANEAGVAHTRAQQILSNNQSALDAYIAWSHGWVGFHAGTTRYRLDELGL
jgi:hypothetical protein